MREIITEAIVLGTRPYKENDRIVDFLTKNSGRVEAVAVSGRKMTSKLAPHCVLGGIVLARLVFKNRITIADSLTISRLPPDPGFRARALLTLKTIRGLVPLGEGDSRVWIEAARIFKGKEPDLNSLLRVFGYDPLLSSCGVCNSRAVEFFTFDDYEFLCESHGRRAPGREIVKIGCRL